MKLTINWLKEHIDTNATAKEILSCLNDIGLQCSEFVFESCWNDIEIVKIISKSKHPDADSLW